jgi:hypothetical protein
MSEERAGGMESIDKEQGRAEQNRREPTWSILLTLLAPKTLWTMANL